MCMIKVGNLTYDCRLQQVGTYPHLTNCKASNTKSLEFRTRIVDKWHRALSVANWCFCPRIVGGRALRPLLEACFSSLAEGTRRARDRPAQPADSVPPAVNARRERPPAWHTS